MKLTNFQVTNAMNILGGNQENSLVRRKLPIGILQALHGSIPKIEAAYKAYHETLSDLCGQYGVTVEAMGSIAEEKLPEFNVAISELLNIEVNVDIDQFDKKLLDNYNDDKYDPMSYVEMELLYNTFTKKEDKKDADNKEND